MEAIENDLSNTLGKGPWRFHEREVERGGLMNEKSNEEVS